MRREPVVVMVADETFAMPLAVTVRSAFDHLDPATTLRLFILDAGLKTRTKRRLLESWPTSRGVVEWIPVDRAMLPDVPVEPRLKHLTYYRLILPRLLPQELTRAIYLDADIVVLADLTRLWNEPSAGQCCLAVQDCSAPFIDARHAIPSEQHRTFVGAERPVPNFEALGLDPGAPYLNAGVLVIDLAHWRAHDISRRLLECLTLNRAHVKWWDQYALNVVLAGRWKMLDARWNQGAHIFKYPSWEESPFSADSFSQQRDDPFIVHFTTSKKPWLNKCRHPLKPLFYEYLDRTVWAGWRPAPPRPLLDAVIRRANRVRRGGRWLRNQMHEWLGATRS